MDMNLTNLVNAYFANYNAICKTFKFGYNDLYAACANLLCSHGLVATPESLNAANRIVKSNSGIFSAFRGNLQASCATMLLTDSDPQQKFMTAQKNYELLKKYFFSSDYLVLTAFLLIDMATPEQSVTMIERGKELYEMMKKQHPILTSSEDSVFAVMLAASPKEDDALIADMEESYRLLNHFSDSNTRQTLSHILALSDAEPQAKCAQLLTLFQTIGAAGGKYGKSYELPVLAALTVLNTDPQQAVNDILAVDAALQQHPDYKGMYGISTKARMMHAAMLVTTAYAPNTFADAAAAASAAASIAAQEAAMCAAMGSLTAATIVMDT